MIKSELINTKTKNSFSVTVIWTIVGFLSLTSISVVLMFLTFLEAAHSPLAIRLVMGFVYIGFMYKSVKEFVILSKHISDFVPLKRKDAMDFSSVAVAGFITFLISNHFGIGAVIGSALVGILGAVLIPKHAVAIFCGSFVGMISQQLTGGYLGVILAGLIAGAIFVMSKGVFNGFGGKLGTIAFASCVLMAVFSNKAFITASVLEAETSVLIIIYSIIGAVLTFVISTRLKVGPVMASGIVGLIGGIILPVIYPSIGNLLSIVVYCASFVGMSSKDKFSSEASIFLSGFIAGIVFILSYPYMGGSGGKLGTIAFISTISVVGMMNILQWFKTCIRNILLPVVGN